MIACFLQPHKYFIQAVVLRKTWPLSRTQWAFVQALKEKELEDLKGKLALANNDVDLFFHFWIHG